MVVTTMLSGVSIAFAVDTDTGEAATGTQGTSVESTEATDDNSSGEEVQSTDENDSSEATEAEEAESDESDSTSSQKLKSQATSEGESNEVTTLSTTLGETTISIDTIWAEDTTLTGDLTVASGATLTLEA